MHPLPRISVGAMALGLTLAFVHPTTAWAGPDADKLRAASESFDAGAKAFKAKQFDQAASYFEAADDAVPSAKALRLAIRARSEAGQSARAATLAAQALDLYSTDTETVKLAQDTIDKLGSSLQQVKISCVSPCLIAAGATPIHGQQATRWTIYLDPGKTKIGATFVGNITAPERQIFAAPGGNATIRFEPPKDDAPKPPDGPPAVPPKGDDAKPTDAKPGEPDAPVEEPSPKKKHFGAHPAVFFVGLGATVGLGAATIWSGVDTQNNPGPDKVRADCAGKGTSCPTYQTGLAHQTRTNVLIGVTAGTAAVTLVIGAFLTNWHGKDKAEAPPETSDPDKTDPGADPSKDPAEKKASRRPHRALAISEPRLWVDVLSARKPDVIDRGSRDGTLDVGGAVLGLEGRF